MKSKRVIAMVSALAIASTLFTGCGSQASSQSTDSGKNVTITFMTWESSEMNAKIVDSLSGFEKENPNIKVKLIPSPLEDYGTKINQMISAKQAPDIFYCGNDWAREKGAAGLLYDYTKKIKSEKGMEGNFYPDLLSQWKSGGHYYGLPGLINLVGIFYNKKMFNAAGIKPNVNWTYQDMYDAAEKLTNKSEKMYGMYGQPVTPFDFGNYSATKGGKPFTTEFTNPKSVTISPEFKEGVELYKKYLANGSVSSPDYDTKNITSMFMQGKVPMMWYGQWAADELIRNAPKDFEWGFLPSPAVDNSKYTTLGGNVGWASPAYIKHPEETWKVFKYLINQTYEKVLAETPVAPPAYKPAAKGYFDELDKTGHSDMKQAMEKMLNAKKIPSSFNGTSWDGKATKVWQNDWNNILEGKSSMNELDSVAKDINDLISSK